MSAQAFSEEDVEYFGCSVTKTKHLTRTTMTIEVREERNIITDCGRTVALIKTVRLNCFSVRGRQRLHSILPQRPDIIRKGK